MATYTEEEIYDNLNEAYKLLCNGIDLLHSAEHKIESNGLSTAELKGYIIGHIKPAVISDHGYMKIPMTCLENYKDNFNCEYEPCVTCGSTRDCDCDYEQCVTCGSTRDCDCEF